MGSYDMSWVFILLYKGIFGSYFFLLLSFYCSFARYILAKDGLFSLEVTIEAGFDFLLVFFCFFISNAIVYSLCYIFDKYLPFK